MYSHCFKHATSCCCDVSMVPMIVVRAMRINYLEASPLLEPFRNCLHWKIPIVQVRKAETNRGLGPEPLARFVEFLSSSVPASEPAPVRDSNNLRTTTYLTEN